jgi:ATP-dependent helicase/nuclease subunit A
MSFAPTEQQRQAIESIQQDTAVTAGAGSGKTRVLVERFIHLLNHGYTIDQIAAITFTKKAAQEMKDRIRKSLPQLADEIEAAQISTIHSLCQRIILEHPREAGIDPRCRVAEEWEADAILVQVISDVIQSVELEDEYRSTSDAVDLIYDLYKQMLSRGDLNFRQECVTPDVDQSITHLCIAVEEFFHTVQASSLTARQEQIIPKLIARWPSIKADLTSGDEVFIEDGLEALEGFIGGNWGKLKTAVAEVKDEIAAVRLTLNEVRGSLVLTQIGEILEKVHQEYVQAKTKIGLLDFGDLELLAARLLSNHQVVQSYDFRQIMVDEFQDTNPLQKQIVDSLCSNGARLFIVGDPKQSIYRFRGAEVEVFTQTKAEISTTGEAITLGDNFRSRPEIIDFTNAFFDRLMVGDSIGYEKSNPKREAKGEAAVHLLITEVEDMSLEEARHLEAAQIALQIRQLVSSGRYNYQDISLLFRTRTNMRLYERALQAAGVPYVNLSGRGFYSRQEVQDILNYFAWLEDAHDDVAKLAVLHSPFYNVSDAGLYWEQHGGRDNMNSHDRAAIAQAERDREHLAKFVRSRPAPYVMQEMLERTDYISTTSRLPFGEQKVANVEKLLQQSWDLFVRGRVSCADQLQYIATVQRRSDNEAEAQLDAEYADVVVIRTVHGSKGLEFPVVFVPDTNGLLTKHSGSQIMYHPQVGLAYKGTAGYDQVKELNEIQELSEARRLLYVAVTRAEEELYLCGISGSSRSTKNSWWHWITETIPQVSVDLYDLVPTLENSDDVALAQTQLAAATEESLSEGRGTLVLEEIQPTYSQVTFSVTALMTYDRCPRCYYRRYILGIPEKIRGLSADGQVDTKARGLSALERGNIVHRVCERITDPTQSDDLIEFAAAMEGVKLTPAVRRDLKQIIQPYLESSFFQRLKEDSEIYREYDFALPLSGAKGEQFVVNGTVDQVFIGRDGLEIVDFKSNWIRPEDVGREGERYRWQLRTYAWAMGRLFDAPVVRSQAYFLIPNQVFALKGAELSSAAIETDLIAACSQIIAGESNGIDAFPQAPDCSDCQRWEE